MDLNSYLIDSIGAATAPPGESADAARTRFDAVRQMFDGYNPADGPGAISAGHCVLLHFQLIRAVTMAGGTGLTPALAVRAQSQIVSISRLMKQWEAGTRRAARPKPVQTKAPPPPAVKPSIVRREPKWLAARPLPGVLPFDGTGGQPLPKFWPPQTPPPPPPGIRPLTVE